MKQDSQIPFPLMTPRPLFLFPVLIFFLLIVFHGAEANNINVTRVGLIIDVNTRIGKEERIAMEIAAQNYNASSKTNKLSLYMEDPFRVSSAGMLSLTHYHLHIFVNINISITITTDEIDYEQNNNADFESSRKYKVLSLSCGGTKNYSLKEAK